MRLMLNGPAGAGKTALALKLQKEAGFFLVNFTDGLKEIAASMLSPYVPGMSVQVINDSKQDYRALLEQLSAHVGYSTDHSYIIKALEGWYTSPIDDVVFDNVRTEAQAEYLRGRHGFKMVALTTSAEAQRQRLGYTVEETEMEAPLRNPDLILNTAFASPTQVYEKLLTKFTKLGKF